jgi:hypothetical protein
LETVGKEREDLMEKKVTLDNMDYKAFQGERERRERRETMRLWDR